MNTNMIFYRFGRLFERVNSAAILLVHTKNNAGYGTPVYAFDLNALHNRYKELTDYIEEIKNEIGWIDETDEVTEVKNRVILEMRTLNEFLDEHEMGFTL